MFKKLAKITTLAALLVGMSTPVMAYGAVSGSQQSLFHGTVDYLCLKGGLPSFLSFNLWLPCFN